MKGSEKHTLTGGTLKGAIYRYGYRKRIKIDYITVGSFVLCGLYPDSDLIRHRVRHGEWYDYMGVRVDRNETYDTVRLYSKGELIKETRIEVTK